MNCFIHLQIRIMVNMTLETPNTGVEDLLAVRMTVTNGIIDPWIYILMRKDNFKLLAQYIGCCKPDQNQFPENRRGGINGSVSVKEQSGSPVSVRKIAVIMKSEEETDRNHNQKHFTLPTRSTETSLESL